MIIKYYVARTMKFIFVGMTRFFVMMTLGRTDM
ncbi:hypothetical protein N186_05300 [Thermofilum adornatum]|uniref:Uncharacterized protein n=1 Tax=Thermofilum adornatum TaxID=1365176 RepID=S5ZLA9_9CREN|nr:hypothetical protein N186_05300 [Thermofilum adornatum]